MLKSYFDRVGPVQRQKSPLKERVLVREDSGYADWVSTLLEYKVDGLTLRDQIWNFLNSFGSISKAVNVQFTEALDKSLEVHADFLDREKFRRELMKQLSDTFLAEDDPLSVELAKVICWGLGEGRDETLKPLGDSYER